MKCDFKNCNFLKVIVGIVIFSMIVVLAQIWGSILAWDTFIKVMVTLGIIVLALILVMIAKNESDDHKRYKDKDLID